GGNFDVDLIQCWRALGGHEPYAIRDPRPAKQGEGAEPRSGEAGEGQEQVASAGENPRREIICPSPGPRHSASKTRVNALKARAILSPLRGARGLPCAPGAVAHLAPVRFPEDAPPHFF